MKHLIEESILYAVITLFWCALVFFINHLFKMFWEFDWWMAQYCFWLAVITTMVMWVRELITAKE